MDELSKQDVRGKRNIRNKTYKRNQRSTFDDEIMTGKSSRKKHHIEHEIVDDDSGDDYGNMLDNRMLVKLYK